MKRIMKAGLLFLIAGLVFTSQVVASGTKDTVAIEILYTSDMNGNILPCKA